MNCCEEARIVHLREVSTAKNGVLFKPADATKGKSRDWLPLLLRETLGTHKLFSLAPVVSLIVSLALVDFKYITPSQIVDIIYEGKNRRFMFQSADRKSVV